MPPKPAFHYERSFIPQLRSDAIKNKINIKKNHTHKKPNMHPMSKAEFTSLPFGGGEKSVHTGKNNRSDP